MLIQFSVENYRSFKSEALLNLAPAKRQSHPNHLLKEVAGKHVEALPLACLFGKNASGKTNLVRAMHCAKNLITKGTAGNQPIKVTPFHLDPESTNKPSRFEFTFTHEKVLYVYGFSVSSEQVSEEWLFAYYSSQEAKVYERITQEGRTVVEAGERLAQGKEEKQFIRFIAKGTRPNQLFLTEAFEKNVKALLPVYQWFRTQLVIVRPDATYFALEHRAHSDKSFACFLERFLNGADTGVSGIETETKVFDPEDIPDVPNELVEFFIEHMEEDGGRGGFFQTSDHMFTAKKAEKGKFEVVRLTTQHLRSDGQLISFDINDESDGTQRLMHLAPILRDLSLSEKVYVVDELDRSLHPELSNLFVRKFLELTLASHSHGQLILTTHESTILDEKSLRRDEIWFVDKETSGSSILTSMSEFKVRSDLRLARGYRQGRFGSVPITSNLDSLLDLLQSDDSTYRRFRKPVKS